MKKMLYITALTSLFVATSCEQKELCMDHSHIVSVQLDFDWAKAPDASPATMSLYLFPREGGKPLRYDVVGREGGTIRVPAGEYDAICLNSDTENILYRNTERQETFEVYTATTEAYPDNNLLKMRSGDDERVALAPDRLWCDHAESLDLTSDVVAPAITLHPKEANYTFSVEIKDVENLNTARGLSATLSGMAAGYLPGKDEVTVERVTMPFEITVSDEHTLTGSLLTFWADPRSEGEEGEGGTAPAPQPETNILTIYADVNEDTPWQYTYDVSEQVAASQEQPEQPIVVEELPLPEPVGGGGEGGGGFQLSVDDWGETVEIVVPM